MRYLEKYNNYILTFETNEIDFIEDWEEEEPDENLVVMDKYDGKGIRVGKFKIDKTDNNLYFFKVPLHIDFQEFSNKLFDNIEEKMKFLTYDPNTHGPVAKGGNVVYLEFHISKDRRKLDFGFMPDTRSGMKWNRGGKLSPAEDGYGYRWYIKNNYKYIGNVEDLI